MDVKIGASILSANVGYLASEIERAEKGGVDFFHIDVMDGYFTDHMTFGSHLIKGIRDITNLPFDVHCYLDHPEKQIDSLAKAGADYITVHPETSPHLLHIVDRIRSYGLKPGIALEPATTPLLISYILKEVNLVTLVTIDPSGLGGQKFKPYQLVKIKQVKNMINQTGLNIDLAVDGGVDDVTAREIVKAGANKLISGSWIFSKNDIKKAIESLKNI